MDINLNMLLSLIIPVYNAEKTISRCLNSLPHSDEVEIIVVNDGSLDKSEVIVKNIMDTNSSIKLFSQENAGPQKAIN
ncbi:MAG: glycosyltransferase [Lachnospiraceae bacterium]|nr:glycosyltransferase [Lachnospiraceae bacterium]